MTTKECCEKCVNEGRHGKPTGCTDITCPCHKEPEAGWEKQLDERHGEGNFLHDAVGKTLYAELKSLIRQQIDKAREEGFRLGMLRDIHQDKEQFAAGQLQALSRIEEEINKMPRHGLKLSMRNFSSEHEGIDTCLLYKMLQQHKAIITKLREEV